MTCLAAPVALFDDGQGGAVLFQDLSRTIDFDSTVAAADWDGENALIDAFAAVETAAAEGEWVVVAADYELGAWFEPGAAIRRQGSRLRAWVFGRRTLLDAGGVAAFFAQRLLSVAAHDRVVGIAETEIGIDSTTYAARIEQIMRWIYDGDGYQVNFTFPLRCRVFGHPLALYLRLRERQPVRYGAAVLVPGATILSYSPELFFERVGSRVVTRPMKGTAPRGKTTIEDAASRDALLASEKERAENVMIVDLLRNDLSRLAAPGKVCVEGLCVAEDYPTVWQMVSTIAADLPGVSLFELFRALFPCGSVTGAPKIAAMRKIAALETSPRGLYTGALGWLAPGGDCRFNVAIRTLEIDRERRATLGIGSGVVIDSKPEREYAECLLKASFLTGYDPGFQLIETLRLERGAYPLLSGHLARLAASAKALGFSCDIEGVKKALSERSAAHSDGLFRVRLTLAHEGAIAVVETPLEETNGPWRAVLAEELLDPEDYLLRHKTTARARYERELARLAGFPNVFDAVFLNTRGEVCEGARSNVFVAKEGGTLLTPPVECGLLPGVLRGHLLDTGRAVECSLTLADLRDSAAVYLGNAVRGLVPVTFDWQAARA
ncbi:aminodeoxychorismate synthase component I [Propionivibrio soli]|uniref:aminodeoxychorismate synthase component I n=1 Tax=Propionivibrio soli TaxID=2976531 RepID=UPI0021E7B62F|nr:aminodeoxychorismate synthase component I [Propionivibrio soli]